MVFGEDKHHDVYIGLRRILHSFCLQRTYGGADTRLKQAIMAWAPRFPSVLSLLGSVCIVYIARKKPKTMYHQLMMAISFADIFSSASFFMSTWPIPPVFIDAAVWGAAGNNGICKAQGLLQIAGSSASAWSNASLSLYYKLVIVDGWRERQFSSLIRGLLLIAPVVIGSTLGYLSYPYIDPSGVSCNFLPFPASERALQFYMITLLPFLICLAVVIGLNFYTCFKFSRQMSRADRWRMNKRLPRDDKSKRGSSSRSIRGTLQSLSGHVSSDTLQGSVVRQSVFYVLAFVAAAPVALTVSILLSNFIVKYWLTLFSMFTAPLQGFNNALIFFRPRIFQLCAERRQKRAISNKQQQQQQQQIPPSPNKVTTGKRSEALPAGNSQVVQRPDTIDRHSGAPPNLSSSGHEVVSSSDSTEFFRSHLYGEPEPELDTDPVIDTEEPIMELAAPSVDMAEPAIDAAEPLPPPPRRRHARSSIVVGSFVLPANVGASPLHMGSQDFEVSDFDCQEEDEVLRDDWS